MSLPGTWPRRSARPHTDEPGNGKVFITSVEDALQVRTGKRGVEAV